MKLFFYEYLCKWRVIGTFCEQLVKKEQRRIKEPHVIFNAIAFKAIPYSWPCFLFAVFYQCVVFASTVPLSLVDLETGNFCKTEVIVTSNNCDQKYGTNGNHQVQKNSFLTTKGFNSFLRWHTQSKWFRGSAVRYLVACERVFASVAWLRFSRKLPNFWSGKDVWNLNKEFLGFPKRKSRDNRHCNNICTLSLKSWLTFKLFLLSSEG